MPRRAIKRRPLTEIPCGDLDKKIALFSRVLKPSGYHSYNATEVFTQIVSVWAKVETPSIGVVEFSEVNLQNRPTHRFTIRYRDDVTAEVFVEFDDNRYDITEVINLEERNEYLVLDCRLQGDRDKAANR